MLRRSTGLVALLVCACAITARAQTGAQVQDVTVCQVLAKPVSFNGQMVRIKGEVVAGFDNFEIRDLSCKQAVNAIWLEYPEGTHGKAGPAALLTLQPAKNASFATNTVTGPAVKLEKNKEWNQFDKLLSTPVKTNGVCLGCMTNTVNATLVGRIDGVETAGLQRDAQKKFSGVQGFGNLQAYRARLVLQSVTDVEARSVDYSKVADIGPAPAKAGDDAGGGGRKGGGGGGGKPDPADGARGMAKAFPPESIPGKELIRIAAVFPKEGEDNGVVVSFGTSNEATKSEVEKGSWKSPDGVLFDCSFDMDRLKGHALSMATEHLGSEIADLRDTSGKTTTLETMEIRGWQATLYAALATREKALILPGAFLLWDASWEPAASTGKANDALAGFLKASSYGVQ